MHWKLRFCAFSISALCTVWTLQHRLQRENCGLSPEQARALVVETLHREGRSAHALGVATPAGACGYTFELQASDHRWAFEVRNDWRSGLRVTRSRP